MKRYNVLDISTFEHFQSLITEDPEGEWVKFDDVEDRRVLLGKIKDLKLKMISIKNPECDCGKMLANYFDESKRFALERWICPAHGYKKI